MILEQPENNLQREAFDERIAVPSRHIISSLGSMTNGFLFSTTPIILRILKEICTEVPFCSLA